MKRSAPNFTAALVSALLSAGSGLAVAQTIPTTATTDPVGFMTLGVNGNGGAGQALSFKGIGLSRPVEYQGSAETATGGTTTVTDTEATAGFGITPTATVRYYLEITSGSAEGTIYDIASVSGSTITLNQSLANSVSAPVNFRLRKHWTIGSVFGPANEAGLGGGAVGEADELLIFNAALGQFETYYYRIGGLGGSSWRNATTGAAAVDQPIYPDDGIVVRRRQAGNINVVLTGAVKTGKTSSPVVPGVNYIANVYATNMTLGSSGLNTNDPNTGVIGGAQGEADEVLIYDPVTKAYQTYYYRLGGLGGSSWRNANDGSLATSTPIPSGSCVVIKRRGSVGFNWVAPQHPASL